MATSTGAYSAKDTAVEEPSGAYSPNDRPADAKPASTARRAADTGLALGRGIVAIPEAAVGVADIVTGGRAGKAVERLGVRFKDAKQVLTDAQSAEQKAADAQVQQADGFLPTLGAMVRNPSTIVNAAAESVPSMLAGGALSRGLVNRGLGAITAGAAGEAAVSAGSSAEQVRQESPTGFLTPKQAALAATSGAATGIINRASGQLADKLGISDVNTALATGKLGGATEKGVARRVAEGAVNEGVLQELPQSAQEQALQNIALDRPVGEGVAQAAASGMLVGGLTGAGFGAVSGGPAKAATTTEDPSLGRVQPSRVPPGVIPSEAGGGNAAAVSPPAAPPPAPPAAPAPSRAQAMGINPTAGPLQAAAGVTVDTGADLVTQQQEVDRQRAEAESKEKAKPGEDGKTPEPQAPAPVQPATPDPTAPVTGPFTQAIHGGAASNVTPPTAPVADPQDAAAAIQPVAGSAVDAPAAPGAGADQGPQGAGAVPAALPEPVTEAPPVAQPPTQESTNASTAEVIDPETGEITRPGPQGEGGDGVQRPADAVQPGADAEGTQRAADEPAAPASAGAPPEGGTAAPVEPSEKDRRLKVVADTIRLSPEGGTRIGGLINGQVSYLGDPDRTMDGRKLMMAVDAALRAGATPQEVVDAATKPAPATPKPLPAEVEAKADEVMRAIGQIGGPIAITREQVVSLINARGIEAADKTIKGILDTIKRNNEAASASARAPKPPTPATPVDMGAHTAATSPLNDRPEPTQAQKEAGNYKKAHLVMNGLEISIENPEGSTRSGVDADGKPWSNTMTGHYGYIKRTTGSDGEQQDVYVKPGTPLDYAGPVFVVDQIDPKTGKHDEFKSMVGYKSPMEARKAYMSNYAKDWAGLKSIKTMTWDEFKAWLGGEAGKKPLPHKGKQADGGTVRGMDYTGRPIDGKPVNAGDIFATSSGRQTTPYPSSKRQQAASQWLIDNAIAEATSRDDTMNAAVFGNEKPMKDGSLPPASQDSMLEYLFGQQPAVPKSILKPLAPASNAGGAAAPQEQAAADKEPTSKAPAKPTGGKNLRGAAYERNPLLTFLAKHGLFHDKDKPGSQKSEFSPDRQVMVMGYGPVFRKNGRQLDELLPLAIQDGYLPPGSDEADLANLIASAIRGNRVAPMFTDDGAEKAAALRDQQDREDYERKQAEVFADLDRQASEELEGALADLTDAEFSTLRAELLDGPVADIDAESNTDVRSAMKALGFTDQEIDDATAQGQGAPGQDGAGRSGPAEAAGQGQGEGAQQGVDATSEGNPDREDLSAPIAPGATSVVRQKIVKRPPGRREESSPWGRFATGEYIVSVQQFDGGPATTLHVVRRTGEMVSVEAAPSEMLETGSFGYLRDAATELFSQQQINAEAVLTAPTRADVIAQQDRAENAQALDDKAQIDRESEGFQLQAQTVDTRTDTTGDMFGGPSVDDYQQDMARRRKPGTEPQGPSLFDQPAEPEPTAPATNRFEAGKSLTKEQRKAVLASLVDVYKAKGAPREQKGIGADGNERYGYVHSPELFEKSDITGAMVRYYVTLPDGRIAHPSELFPDYTQADIDAAMAKNAADERNDADSQRRAEANAEQFSKPSAAEADADWVRRNPGPNALVDWRTNKRYSLVPMTKDGKFYSVRDDDTALMKRLERAGWVRADAAGNQAEPAAQATAILDAANVTDSDPQDRNGLRAEDRRLRAIDAAAEELAGQLANDMLDGQYATPSDRADIAKGLKLVADDAKVPVDDLREAVLKRIKADERLSKRQTKQIVDALNPTKTPPAEAKAELPGAQKPAEVTPPAWHTAIPDQGTKVVPADEKNYSQIPHRVATEAVEAVTQTQSMGNMALYAYVLPATDGHHGAARLFPDDQTPPAPWSLLFPEAMRMGMLTKEQAVEKLASALRRAPILGTMATAQPENPRLPKPGEVDNFGETLPPARRNMAAKLDEDLTDDDIANRPLSEIWPLAENQAIEDTFAAAVAHAARAEVPSKPRVAYKLKQWVQKVKAVRELAAMIVSGRFTREQFIAKAPASLKDWMTKVMLLEQIPRDQWNRVDAVEERPDSFGYKDGQQVRMPHLNIRIDGKSHWLTGDADIDGDVRGTLVGNMQGVRALLAAAEPEERMQFEIRQRRGGKVFINKKGDSEYRALMEFDVVADARKAINEQYAELVAAWEATKARDNITERDLRSAENRPRVGKDHRSGRDVTPEEFQSKFGFRGGEFGKWVKQGKGDKERQAILNSAYDALMDLASIAGIPPRAISLNGTLGIAFGSRGSGWASAHFEPGNLVMNLTKTRGAGALAHEWFHALDNYFSRMRRGGEEDRNFSSAKQYNDQNFITHRPEPMMVPKNVLGGRYLAPMTLGKLQAMHEARKDKTDAYNPDNWQRDPKTPEGVRPEVEARFAALVDELNKSPMTKRAMLLDGVKSGEGYWSRTLERAARAFESYVIAKMHEEGYHNDFLVNVKKSDETGKAGDRYPYLMAGEVKPIAEAFDALFDTLETAEDDAGNVAIREPESPYETDLFGQPVPAPAGRPAPARPKITRIRGDVQPASGVQDTPAPAGEYFASTIVGSEVSRELGASKITTPEQAAQATAYLYKSAVERLDGIVTDANGKPLGIVGGFKGALAQASVYPATLVAEAVRIPGAARIWFSHNHPSGNPQLSRADEMLNQTLTDVFRGSGIEPMGLLAIGDGRFSHVGNSSGSMISNEQIPAPTSRVSVPVIERTLAPNGITGTTISSPQAAKQVARDFYDRAKQPGLMLLNSQNGVIGWVPITDQMKGELRGTGGLNAIYRAISESNAGAAIIVHGGELTHQSIPKRFPQVTPSENIAAALSRIDVRPLDSIEIRPTRTKSAAEIGMSIADGPVFARGNPFYSALTAELSRVNAAAQPALGWANTINGLVKAGKVKQDEVTWSGVLDWLKLQEGKVTREQVVQFLDANGVKVEETVLGGDNQPPGYDADIELLSDNGLTLERNPEDPGMVAFMDENGDLLRADELAEEPGLAKELVLAAYRVQEAAEAGKVPTKYGTYQLPGGTKYREVLLTLPVKSKWASYDSAGNLKLWIDGEPTQAQKDAAAIAGGYLQRTMLTDAAGTFKSGHWDEPNILAHIRVNDRTDADGKRVLFVEEIQSDWGQQGKKQGFKPGAAGQRRFQELGAEWDSLARIALGPSLTEDAIKAREQARQRQAQISDEMNAISDAERDGLPGGPFVTKTDAWLSLALKRIVKMAVDEGYDRVAFINGEQSAERYSLDKLMNSITAYKRKNGNFNLEGFDVEGRKVDIAWDIEPAKIDDYIGKELAKKIDADLKEADRSKTYSGGSLKVEAKGMRAFYDQIVPSVLKDVLRKVGGGALETVELQLPGLRPGMRDPETGATLGPNFEQQAGVNADQPGFTITPAMQERAADGLPLFDRSTGALRAVLQSMTGQGMTVEQVQAIVQPMAAKWDVDVRVVARPADLPIKAPSDAMGLHYNGVIYIVARTNRIQAQVLRTLAHETIAHYGLRSMLGRENWRAFMRQIQFAARRKGGPLQEISDYIRRTYVDENGQFNLSEVQEGDEIAARVVELGVDPSTGEFRPGFGMLKAVFARVAEFLRGLGFTIEFTNLELQGMLVRSQRALARRSGRPVAVSGVAAARGGVRADVNRMTSEQMQAEIRSLIPRVEQAYEDGNQPLAERLDARLETLMENLEANYLETEEDRLTAVDMLNPMSAARVADGEQGDTEADLVRDLANTWKEMSTGFGWGNQNLSDAEKAAQLRGMVDDYAYRHGGIKPGVTDQQILDAAEDAFQSVYGMRAQQLERIRQRNRPPLTEYRPDDPTPEQLAAQYQAMAAAGDASLAALRERQALAGNAENDQTPIPDWMRTAQFRRGPDLAAASRRASNTAAHYRSLGLQALGRRQITELYGNILHQLHTYNRLMAQMDADKNEVGAQADQIAKDWGNLKDERELAELMHDATLAQMDPEKPLMRGDDPFTYDGLRAKFVALSPEARQVYVQARDAYREHHENVRQAIRDRIERSELRGQRKAELLQQMDSEFYKAIKGVYFPLARFGDYVVIVRDPTGKVLSVNRAETLNEAEALQASLRQSYPGMTVGKVLKSKEFNAGRDAVGRGFMQNLYEALGRADMDDMQRGELEDMLGQLYLSALPDLSWAKHGIHRKGTPGFSQDARRAFAQNTFHGARYLAKVRYSDLLENQLIDAQKQVDALADSDSYDSVKAQQVIDEMVKRHDAAMNPNGNALSTALTSVGFVFHLGLSPASAMVNLTQTALVALPLMGSKWGFSKSTAALLKASQQAASNGNDISKVLSTEERRAFDEAVRSGVIDVTMAHDLAGISQGEDAKVAWKMRPVMRWASFLFHHAEKFNRQVTFVAAYRLAREAGTNAKQAYEQAVKATYDGHFDYSASNRPRIMQGNVAKVVLLFKQYGQNMVYTLSRQAYLAMKGRNPYERAQARRALGGLLAMHGAAAGVLGLPMVSTLLAAASFLGGDDDEPWDAEVALRNMLADALGDQAADVLARGLSRLTPWDISGRVGLDKLILPDIQEGLEGQDLANSAMAAALGPVAGIAVSAARGMQEIAGGNWARGLEAMAPSLARGPLKALRYGTEGAIDKTGKPIVEDVGAAGVIGQALGFSPSEVRLATEAKSAVHQADARLVKRRADLMRHYAMAVIQGDQEGAQDALADIRAFNEKNPGRRINPLQMAKSVAMRRKQIAQSEGGVYLPRSRRDAMQAGEFGMP